MGVIKDLQQAPTEFKLNQTLVSSSIEERFPTRLDNRDLSNWREEGELN